VIGLAGPGRLDASEEESKIREGTLSPSDSFCGEEIKKDLEASSTKRSALTGCTGSGILV
jgi:hypothetical protein